MPDKESEVWENVIDYPSDGSGDELRPREEYVPKKQATAKIAKLKATIERLKVIATKYKAFYLIADEYIKSGKALKESPEEIDKMARVQIEKELKEAK